MLIRFVVENFLSFKEAAEFSMVAGKGTRHKGHVANCSGRRILKGAFMFGANASGKTNFTRAMAFAKNIIVNGLSATNCEKKYFRIDSSYKDKPSVFQFDFLSNGHFYSYGFALSMVNRTIEEEWLYQIDDKETCVFLRGKDANDRYTIQTDLKFNTSKEKERFNFYAEDICNPKMNQTLYLADVVKRVTELEKLHVPLNSVMEWFEKLTVIFPDSQYDSFVQLLDDSNERTRMENLLRYFDTGIQSLKKQGTDLDKALKGVPEKILDDIKTNLRESLKEGTQKAQLAINNERYEVALVDNELIAFHVVSDHGNKDDLFENFDESDGTQRLFDLIPIFQRAINDYVIVIDEIDRSLHTKAVQEFINYFYDLVERKNSQLIVTTHDSNIMDLDFIRQDEIWFVERQMDSGSKLYSLNKFRERFDKKVEKEYLIGRYGAIPVFKHWELSKGGELNEYYD